MAGPSLVCVVDEAPASAALFAALIGILAGAHAGDPRLSFGLTLDGPRESILDGLARTCARRGLAVERGGERSDAIRIAGRAIELVPERRSSHSSQGGDWSARARLRERRVELERSSGPGELDGQVDGQAEATPSVPRLGERVELLAAGPLLDLLEHGSGLRWAVLSVIEGRDAWHASVDLSEAPSAFGSPDASLDAGLRRSFPALVGRVAWSSAIGPQLGAALHLNVLLGTGASIEGLHDQIAQLAQQAPARSRWPRLRAPRSCGSADTLGDPRVLVDLDAIVSAGPLVRIATYYDPPAILAGDLLRRLALG